MKNKSFISNFILLAFLIMSSSVNAAELAQKNVDSTIGEAADTTNVTTFENQYYPGQYNCPYPNNNYNFSTICRSGPYYCYLYQAMPIGNSCSCSNFWGVVSGN
jgi:hypothetical protein